MKARCSVVVPVHGREALTKRCLESVMEARPVALDEVIVVDDGSTGATRDVVDALGEGIRYVRLSSNSGFAVACNAGARAARSVDFLVFLNNDTVADPGWLDTLVAYAVNQDADIVGPKLLYPNDTVQHAGVVICQDGLPRNLYAGFPADHRAVSRSRRLQAVTGACMLVRRPLFEEMHGFDAGFRNCMEDVDFCLRAGRNGAIAHYCADATLHHLESASRGRSAADAAAAVRRFRERWRGQVRPDDVDVYLKDGLITIGYDTLYPVQFDVAPELAALRTRHRRDAVERLLTEQTRRCADLLHETVRLTVQLAGERFQRSRNGSAVPPGIPASDALFDDFDALESQLYGLQLALADHDSRLGEILPSKQLAYRALVREVRDAVEHAVPPGSGLAVISRGDDSLLELGDRLAWHFPADADGAYLGYYPASGEEALEWLLESARRGADYLVVPDTSRWWLAQYSEFGGYLKRLSEVTPRNESCSIYRLETEDDADGRPTRDVSLAYGR